MTPRSADFPPPDDTERTVANSLTPPAAERLRVQRFFWLPLGLASVVVLAVLAALVVMSWLSLDRLQPVQAHLAHIARIQDVGLGMEQTLLRGLRGSDVSATEIDELVARVDASAGIEGALHPETQARLARFAQRMAQAPPGNVDVLFETLAAVRQVLAEERAQHDTLLAAVTASTRVEMRLAVTLLLVLPLVGAVGLWLLRRRTEQPLRDLEYLLNRLSGHAFQPVPADVLELTTRLARPAFNSYNLLVSRLQALEAEHQDRERTLERRVRDATEALLAQNRELARAERLAAVGAVSAGLAHELRNPLAGVQLACSKLQQKLGDGDHTQRIAAVIGELKRINRLLTDQVDAARHAPEALVDTDIAVTVDELLALLRYQVPGAFRMQAAVAAGLCCLLPVAGLRQALLNLVLNAVQIQGEQGSVEIVAQGEDDQLVIRVVDDGPGFPAEMLRAGIRPFATGRAGGSGLGLAMVRRFVRDLDGELTIENRTPRGAQVTLRLPCRAITDGEDSDA